MILRTTFKGGYQSHTLLGERFDLVSKEGASEKFSETANLCFGENDKDFTPETLAFVIHHNGREVEPIYIGQKNEILNPDGTLFQTLSTF